MADVPAAFENLADPDDGEEVETRSSSDKREAAPADQPTANPRALSAPPFPFSTSFDLSKINPAWPPDSYASTAIVEIMDRAAHAAMGRATLGLSPSALTAAYLDWISHLAFSPGKQLQLLQKAQKKFARYANYAARGAGSPADGEAAIEPLKQDKRFDGEAWRQWPYNMMSQGFLFTQQWWHNATTGVRGVTPQHERVVEFAARQMLDMVAPSNFLWTNPEVLQKTILTGGANLVAGWRNLLEDLERTASAKPPVGAEAFVVGEDVATTPGKVVYRNRLIELIQYTPSTKKVHAEPILIIPAWIMKFYILDLSPHNSLVRYLVEQGHTVFMVSWKNPGPEDRDLSFDDYRKLGVLAALDAVGEICGEGGVHGVGYCLGGTLLGVAAAAMADAGDDRFTTLTFLASQFDFSEAGELTLFINESQVTFLEDIMWEQGYLDSKQMAGAFQMLRSIDLIWSRLVCEYLLGERRPVFDLIAWNADATRMPFKMHAEYLRQFFLNNDFAEGRYRVNGRITSIADIRAPIFSVATTRDHVAPWRSAYKVHGLADTEVTFLLTNGGHNAGIVSEPGHQNRQYRQRTMPRSSGFMEPDIWYAETAEQVGSWWPAWRGWLAAHSTGGASPPRQRWVPDQTSHEPPLGAEMTAAPGAYVLMKQAVAMIEMMRLDGKVGLIAGVANGDSIAAGCAKAISAAGAELILTCRDETSLPFAAPTATSTGAAWLAPMNVQDETAVDAVFMEIERRFQRLDFLIHSMAYSRKEDLHGRVVDSSRDGFAEAMDISCHSFIRLAKRAEPFMADGGAMIAMSFVGAEKVVDNYGLMGPVKAALEASVRYIAAELGEKNIRVNALSPGPIRTRAASGLENVDDLIRDAAERSPMPELATIDDVGAYAAFLVSDAAKSVTGSVLYVDGGYHIMSGGAHARD